MKPGRLYRFKRAWTVNPLAIAVTIAALGLASRDLQAAVQPPMKIDRCELQLTVGTDIKPFLRAHYIFLDDEGFIKGTSPLPHPPTGIAGQLNEAFRSLYHVSKMKIRTDGNYIYVYRRPGLAPKVFHVHTTEAFTEFTEYARYFELLSRATDFENLGLRVDPDTLEVRGSPLGSAAARALEYYRWKFGVTFTIDPDHGDFTPDDFAGGCAHPDDGKIWLNPLVGAVAADDFVLLLRHEVEHVVSVRTGDFLRQIQVSFEDAGTRKAKWGLYARAYFVDELEANLGEIAEFLRDPNNYERLYAIDDQVHRAEIFITEQRRLLETLHTELSRGVIRGTATGGWFTLRGRDEQKTFSVLLPLAARLPREMDNVIEISQLDQRELAFAMRMVKARLVRVEGLARLLENLLHDPGGSWAAQVNRQFSKSNKDLRPASRP